MADVLVVDDSLTVRMDLCQSIEATGLKSFGCATVDAARRALATNSFSLIILDVVLPDADGVEFLKELKSSPATAGIPVMLLSSEAEVKDRVRGLQTGADEYLGKPYDLSYLLARAGELVRKREPQPNSHAHDRILIIDDSATMRAELRAALEADGYEVSTAITGEEGLRAVVDLRPSGVIVDGILPGIDGPTVIRRIKLDAALRRTPCLLLTASNDRDDELRALDAGGEAFVRKEEGIEVILARMQAMLRFAGETVTTKGASSVFGPKRILAIDDSPTYLNELTAQLRAESYDVVMARSGEEALELLSVQLIDCILLDLIMPGLSGEQTCRQIRNIPAWRSIPLIMLTSQEGREAMIQGINAGADDYIVKSSDFELLKARVRAQMRRKQLEDENQRSRGELLHQQIEAARAARELAELRAVLLAELETKAAELRSANKELERSNAELERFAYVAYHDLQEPLRSVTSYVQLLQKRYRGKLDSAADEFIQFAVDGALRMKQLIKDLLTYSEIEKGKPLMPTETAAALEAVLADLSPKIKECGARVTYDHLPVALADESQLRKLFQHLIGNALKFSGDCAQEIHIGAERRHDGWLFSVRDNGIGIDPQFSERIFMIFQRLHSRDEYPGTGIGLSICKRIVERHGGSIWVESEPGKGSTFYLTLRSVERSLPGQAGGLTRRSDQPEDR